MKKICTLLLVTWCISVRAVEVMPPRPLEYFNDYAGVVSSQTAAQLNARLVQFERGTSNQVVVAVFPKMQTDSSIEDYTVRVAESWKVGQKDKKNGAVLFVFIQDRKMFLQVGYGLEAVLPDALCKRIIESEIKPRFRAGDYEGGLSAGVGAVLAATKGEYKGSGRTVAQGNDAASGLAIVVAFMVLIFVFTLRNKSCVYGASGRRYGSGWYIGGGGGSGGFGGGNSGGGFSGGGGSFGGGGAGGGW